MKEMKEIFQVWGEVQILWYTPHASADPVMQPIATYNSEEEAFFAIKLAEKLPDGKFKLNGKTVLSNKFIIAPAKTIEL